VGNSGANILSGMGGNDNLQGAGGADSMIGGDGNDLYYIENVGDTVTEGNGPLSGIDTIYSTVTLTNFANVERVVLQGSSAINATGLDGQNDQLTGNAGVNTLSGGSGNDTLDGLGGADIMIGGDGNDSFYVDTAGDTITEAAGATAGTNDSVYSTISFTNVANVERVTLAGIGNINATGFAAQNEIFFGNNGNNAINGGDGADLMSGGFGLDTLTGGLGNDTFRFDKNLNALTNKDTITDYNVANDTIQLDNAIFTQLFATLGNPTSTGTMHASLFGFAATIDADDRIVYNATTGELSYDINGSVAGGATVFAQLSAGLAITNLDFVVI
jgi:Ca2+-binding RTX toxin-like protein